MKTIKIKHPKIERAIDVDVLALKHYKRSGWEPVTPDPSPTARRRASEETK